MLVLNWQKYSPTDRELEFITQNAGKVVHVRILAQGLVREALTNYPWIDRPDLASIFDPSRSYEANEIIALPERDPQGLRPDSWRIGRVASVVEAENPAQGKFQVLTIDIDGQKQMLAAAVPGAHPLPLEFPPIDA